MVQLGAHVIRLVRYILSCEARSRSVADGLYRNRKRWRDGHMPCRWAGATLPDAKKRFNRVKGYREMPFLVEALAKGVDSAEAVA